MNGNVMTVVAVPQWLPIGAIATGALLLIFGRRK